MNPPFSPEELERRRQQLLADGHSPGMADLLLRREVRPARPADLRGHQRSGQPYRGQGRGQAEPQRQHEGWITNPRGRGDERMRRAQRGEGHGDPKLEAWRRGVAVPPDRWDEFPSHILSPTEERAWEAHWNGPDGHPKARVNLQLVASLGHGTFAESLRREHALYGEAVDSHSGNWVTSFVERDMPDAEIYGLHDSDWLRPEIQKAAFKAYVANMERENPPGRGDARLRELERRAALGDKEALAALRAAEARSTDVPPPPEFEAFFKGYVECMLWSAPEDDDGNNLDGYTADEIDGDAMEEMRSDCEDFFVANMRDLQAVIPFYEASSRSGGGDGWELAGHDFCLTRNGHGTGFWDRGPEAIWDALSDACEPYGEQNLYLQDDEKIGVM